MNHFKPVKKDSYLYMQNPGAGRSVDITITYYKGRGISVNIQPLTRDAVNPATGFGGERYVAFTNKNAMLLPLARFNVRELVRIVDRLDPVAPAAAVRWTEGDKDAAIQMLVDAAKGEQS